MYNISEMSFGPEATCSPPRHSGRWQHCFCVPPDASRPPLEIRKVLSDSARACSGAPESTCSYGDAFRMLQDLTNRLVKDCISWDLWTDWRSTSREAEATVQLCGRLGAVFSLQWFLDNLKALCLIIFAIVTVTRFTRSQNAMHYSSLAK
jgi:hypothetical protein